MVKSVKAALVSSIEPEAYVLQAIVGVKEEGKKGLSSWKLNPAFRAHFGDTVSPIETTTKMRKDGKIAVFLQKGGASFYLRGDLKESTLERHDADWVKFDAGKPRS